jgi:hypothetical protein
LKNLKFNFLSVFDLFFQTRFCLPSDTPTDPSEEERDDDGRVDNDGMEDLGERREKISEEPAAPRPRGGMSPEDDWWYNSAVQNISVGDHRPPTPPTESTDGLVDESTLDGFVTGAVRGVIGHGESLSGVSSLQVTEIIQRIRKKFSNITTIDLINSNNLNEFIEIVKLKQSNNSEPPFGESSRPASDLVRIPFTPGQINRPCRWMMKSKKPIDPARVRIALDGLVARHPLLRCEIEDPKGLFSFYYDVGVLLTTWHKFHSPSWFSNFLTRVIHSGWPRVRIHGTAPSWWGDRISVKRFDNFDHFRRNLFSSKNEKSEFWHSNSSPIEIEIFNSEFLLLSVKHSVSDGNSAFPLMDDLAALYEGTPLPQIPSPLPDLEKRLLDGLLEEKSNPNRASIRTMNFYDEEVDAAGGGYYRHYICIEKNSIEMLKFSSKTFYEISFDSLVLSLIILSLLRADRETSETMTLYTPLRDGESQSSWIGLLADWRDLTVECLPDSTVMDVVFLVADKVKNRDWTPTLSPGNPDSLLINWLPFDGTPRLSDGSWEPYHLDLVTMRWNRMTERDWDRRSTPSGRFRSMTLDQYETNGDWWMRFDVATKLFPPKWMMKFSEEMNNSFSDLINYPLKRVHPVDKKQSE